MVRVHFGPPLQKKNLYGGLAQLGERLPCKQEVTGSIPVLSTTQEIDWSSNESWNFIEFLERGIQTMHLENWTLLNIDAIYEKATVKETF